MIRGRNAALCAALLALCGTARADITFGGNARAFGMGGAGIAIVDRSERNTLLNPAALALFNRRIKVEYPHIGLRASGVPLDKAYDHLLKNPSANDAVSIARDFGKRDSSYGASLGWGLRIGHMDAHANGQAQVRVLPNAALQTWANTANGDVTKLTGGERADLIGAAIYSLPEAGAAERISPEGSPIRVEAGVRVRLERAVYSHYIVNSSNILNNTAATPAPELNGGTTITKDGVGADLGLLVHPAEHKGFSAALVVFNLLEPNFRITGTDQNGNPAKYDLQPRSVSVGSAWEGGRIVAAFDVVDLTRAYDNVQARMGAEYTTKGIALRAGYSSARGFTAGFGWGWLQLAFGARAPLEVTSTLRF
jgi:hypothetical protein